MSNQINLFLLTLIATILLSSSYAVGSVFADSDDDQHDGKLNKKNRVWTGDGPPNSKLGKVGDLYVDNHNNIYNLYKKTAKNTWTDVPDIQGTPGPKGDTGSTGQQGFAGADGTPGQNGISCWDANGNAHNDPSEDINGDSLYNGLDCQGPQGEPGSNTDVTDLQNQINSLITQINQLNSQFQSVQKTLCNDDDPFTSDMISPATNQCVNSIIICNDDNPVTTDVFDPSSEQCLNLECDDNDPLTFDTVPPFSTQCANLPIQTCDDNNPYTIDTYNGLNNSCIFESLPYGTLCDDGNPLTENDIVQDGYCAGNLIDADFDGFILPTDCDDTNASVYPGATEVFNGLDDNCNSVVDEGVIDADYDGFILEVDCDDTNASVNPAAVEVFNGLDDNCNGAVDEVIVIDNDFDGYPATVDCDDNNASVNPGVTEVFADGIDNNCNGIVDEIISALYFEDDFSDNSAGWTLGATWQIGSTITSPAAIIGNPDPSQDNTPTNDNGVAGVVLGGNAITSPHPFYYLESPVINTASASGPVILEYSRWLNSDYSPYMTNQVQVYDGSTWQTVWQSGPSPGIVDNSWAQHTSDITAFKNANMKVRFGYDATSGAFSVSGWNLEDIKISTP